MWISRAGFTLRRYMIRQQSGAANSNGVGKTELISHLRYEKPNLQICFRTEKALELLHFEGSELYIYNDSQTYIDEVVLGARMDNPENYVPFIYKQGKKMWKDEKENYMKVTQSKIQYK